MAWSTLVPINGSRMFDATVDGYRPQPQEEVYLYTSAVGPEYFQTAGTRVLKGRTFSTSDSASSPLVGIVNTAAVRKYWSDRDPLNGRIRVDETWIQIVGVVEDAKIQELDEEPIPYIYLPFAQESAGGPLDPVHLFVRTSGDETALLGPLRDVLRSLDPDAPVYNVTTFAWRVRQLVMPQRMGGALFGVFGSLAVVLAAIGIYGVASYVAASADARDRHPDRARRRSRADPSRSCCVRTDCPVAAGLVAGLVLAGLAAGSRRSFLRGVTPHDPLTYAAVTLFFGCVAMAATWIPARRAAQLEPMSALRQT